MPNITYSTFFIICRKAIIRRKTGKGGGEIPIFGS